MRSMGGCSKAEKNGSSIRKMAFLRKIPLCYHDSRKYRGCDADRLIQNSCFLRYLYVEKSNGSMLIAARIPSRKITIRRSLVHYF